MYTLLISSILILVLILIMRHFAKIYLHVSEDLPYRKKTYFFTRSEYEFFQILRNELNQTKYVIFPKVRLGDYVEVSLTTQKRLQHWNRIKSRHIDFIIWDTETGTIKLAIELDGNSHNTNKSIHDDNFKNMLFEKIDITLIRIKVGSDFIDEIKKLTQILQIENTIK